MKREELLDAIGQIDDAMILEAKEKRKKPLWSKALAAAACLCVVLAVLLVWQPWSEQRLDGNPDTIHMTEDGVVIPKMQIQLPAAGAQMDMIGFFIYNGRSYVHYTWVYDAPELAGECLGTATGNINEWSRPDEYVELSGSVSGDFYAVNGFDASFMLCMKHEDDALSIYINDNGLTLKTGADLYEERLHLAENYVSLTVQTREDWYYSTGEEYSLGAQEEVLTAFVQALNEGTFLPQSAVSLPGEQTSPFDTLERYHLFFQMENGMMVHLRLWEGGYVYFNGLRGVCVQMEKNAFDAFVDHLNGLCQTD